MARRFSELSESDILALAISLEEEDGRIYADFADGLREHDRDSAKIFDDMREEGSQHRASLIEIYRNRLGDHIPLIRRHDVKGFIERRPVWRSRPLGIQDVRKQVEVMELESRRFYERAVEHVSDAGVRKLLGDLAEVGGRGRPVLRGSITGLMTAAGGIGHTLPFRMPEFRIAMAFAVAVVAVELGAISYIRHHYMDTPLLSAAFQVVVGGVWCS